MVRDPVRRVLSHLAHLRAEPGVWLPETAAELNLPLADWLGRRPLALFDNNQVRYLSGSEEFDGMAMTRPMTQADLEKALEVTRSCVFAAPMESFDESLLLWAERFEWADPYYRRINVRAPGARLELSDADRELLESWNRLDRILWEEVTAQFLRRVEEYERGGKSLQQEVASFRVRNATTAVQMRLLAHTARRGIRHPVRAARSVTRAVRQRMS